MGGEAESKGESAAESIAADSYWKMPRLQFRRPSPT